jgi:hypothetical protein
VTRGERGKASCATCGGGFVALPVAFAAFNRAGLDALHLQAVLARDGRQVNQCVTCEALLASFPVLDEIVHVCVPCVAVWLAADALARLEAAAANGAQPTPPPPPAPAPAAQPAEDGKRAKLEALAELAPAIPPTPNADQGLAAKSHGSGASANASDPLPDISELSDADGDSGVVIDLDDSPAGSNERPHEVPVVKTWKSVASSALASLAKPATASSTLMPRSTLAPRLRSRPERARRERKREPASEKRFPFRKLFVLLAILGGLRFGVSMISGPRQGEPLGGGRAATFWNAPVQVTRVALGGRTVTRFSALRDDQELIALFVPGGGVAPDGAGGKIALIQLLGDEVVLLGSPAIVHGLAVFSANVTWRGAPTRTGRARAYFGEKDAWILVAVAPDGGDFGQSAAAEAYMSSLATLP